MFARIVRMGLKPGQGPAYTRAIEQRIIPAIRKFAGFRDEIAMVSSDGKEAIGISLWQRKEDAEVYDREGYKDVRKMLEPFSSSPPELRTYDVTVSTVHEPAGAGAGARRTR